MPDSLQEPANSALVLYSGGQDSATCLAWALARYERVETVGFDYGQRHAVEMQARLDVRSGMGRVLPRLANRLGPDLSLIHISSPRDPKTSRMPSSA